MLESMLMKKKNILTNKIFDIDFSTYALGTTTGFSDAITGRAISPTSASPGSIVDHATLGRSFYFNGTGGLLLSGAAPDILNRNILVTAEMFCEDTTTRFIAYTGIAGTVRTYGWSIMTNIAAPYGDTGWLDHTSSGSSGYTRLYYNSSTPKTGARVLRMFMSPTLQNVFKIDNITPPSLAVAPARNTASGPALYIGVSEPAQNNIYLPFKGWVKRVSMEVASSING